MTLETVLKFFAGSFATVSILSGFFAAFLWYRSAANNPSPKQIQTYFGNVDGEQKLATWLTEAATLNKWAAMWTGVSVGAAGLCTLLDHMS